MEFSPSTIAQGGVSRLSYGLRNDAAVGATSISLSDTLPADVVVAGVPDASTTCGGGTVTAAAGGDTLAFAGGAVAAGVSCTISVDVTSAVAGSYLERPGGRDLVAWRQHAGAGDADGRCGGCAGLFQGVFAGHDRSGRDFQADVHDRQWGQPDRCRVAGLYRCLPVRSCRGRDPQRVDADPAGSTAAGRLRPGRRMSRLPLPAAPSRPGQAARFPLTCVRGCGPVRWRTRRAL